MDLTKRYVIESIHDPFVIEFTVEQDIYDNEIQTDSDAYECYVLDGENEPSCRAVYYYDGYTGKNVLTLIEGGEKIRVKIHRTLPIDGDDTIEETINKADEHNGLTMGDIC